MVAVRDFSGLVSSPWALASAAAMRQWFHWSGALLTSASIESKLMAPDLERLARRPWPVASLASSGTNFLSSVLALRAPGGPGLVRR